MFSRADFAEAPESCPLSRDPGVEGVECGFEEAECKAVSLRKAQAAM